MTSSNHDLDIDVESDPISATLNDDSTAAALEPLSSPFSPFSLPPESSAGVDTKNNKQADGMTTIDEKNEIETEKSQETIPLTKKEDVAISRPSLDTNKSPSSLQRNIPDTANTNKLLNSVVAIGLILVIAIGIGLGAGLSTSSKQSSRDIDITFIQPQTIGLALSGGAFPGGVVAGGIMRGFQKQIVTINGQEKSALQVFNYTVGVSGGNFANVLYSFAPNTTSDVILDAGDNNTNTDPSKITIEEMENIPSMSMFSRFNVSIGGYLAYALYGSIKLDQGDVWELFVHELFLKPFGMADFTQPIGKTRDGVHSEPICMTSVVGPSEVYPEYVSDKHMNRLFANMVQDIKHKFGTVYTAVNNSTKMLTLPDDNNVLWEIAKLGGFRIPYGASISADEFAIPILEHTAKYPIVGNKTADDINFVPVSTHPDNVQPSGQGHFSLAKMLGVSISILIMRLNAFPDRVKAALSTPSEVEVTTKDGDRRKFALSDGGYNAINGIGVLVKKRVRKIICNLYNTQDRILQYRNNGFNEPWIVGYIQILKFFGVVTEDLPSDYESHLFASFYTLHFFDLHSNGENQVNKFLESITSLYKAGEPMIVTLKNLDVIENRFWGIEAGGKVDLTVIVNAGVPRKFAEQVPLDIVVPPDNNVSNVLDTNGFFTNEKYNTVPNLAHQREGSVEYSFPFGDESVKKLEGVPDFSLTTENIQMTKLLSSWMIEHAWEELVGDDGEVKFEGFKALFQSQ